MFWSVQNLERQKSQWQIPIFSRSWNRSRWMRGPGDVPVFLAAWLYHGHDSLHHHVQTLDNKLDNSTVIRYFVCYYCPIKDIECDKNRVHGGVYSRSPASRVASPPARPREVTPSLRVRISSWVWRIRTWNKSGSSISLCVSVALVVDDTSLFFR